MALLAWKREKPAPPTETFAALAMPLLPSLYNVAMWLTRENADAEDLVQETFLKGLRGFASFDQGSNFKAWIFRNFAKQLSDFAGGSGGEEHRRAGG